MTTIECQICSEKYNKSTRKQVTCICGKHCCRTCVKAYIETKSEDAHCMFCKIKWNRDFLYENLEQKYLNENYKEIRRNLLFEKEMGMLPATQVHVEKEIKIEEMTEELNELEEEKKKIEQKFRLKMGEINRLKNNSSVERKKYVRKCPSTGCHGFLSTQLKCELCSVWVCSECREIKGTDRDVEHICNPEILESVKMLEADTKPCPNCSAMIHKIEGCNQMFCTECHTAFDWTNLRIVTGLIHNPHYFEWQRRTRNGEQAERNPNDVLCGRELDNNLFLAIQTKIIDDYNNRYSTETGETPKKYRDELMQKMVSVQIGSNHVTIIMSRLEKVQVRNYRNSRAINMFQYCKDCQIIMCNYWRQKHTNGVSEALNVSVIETTPIAFYLKKIDIISDIIRSSIHIRLVETARWNNDNQLNNNLNLRVQFMRNKITEEWFKIQIEKKDKEVQRNTEYGNVLRMYTSCMTDLLYRIHDDINQYDAVLPEMHELRKYTNQCIIKTLKQYGSSMNHQINVKFEYEVVRKPLPTLHPTPSPDAVAAVVTDVLERLTQL